MNRAFLVAQREFLENVRTKGFWIGILMMPLMLILFATVPFLVESTRAAKTYTVIDDSGWLLGEIHRQIDIADLTALMRAEPPAPGLPAPFGKLQNVTAELDDNGRRALAQAIFDGSTATGSNLPPAAETYLEDQGATFAAQWRALSPADKAALSPAISTNQFVFVPPDGSVEQLNRLVQKNELFAYFVIGPDPLESDEGFRYVSNNLTDRDLLGWFSDFANERIRARRLAEARIDDETADWIRQRVGFEGIQISSEGLEQEVGTDDVVRQWVPVVFVYLLWISILLNTQMLLTSTIEEKSNKLVEVLLSSISAMELMAGKILGIAVTGLAIIAAWALMAAFFFIALPAMVGLSIPLDLSSVVSDPIYLGSFLVYFILGYLLYAAILVGLGSICSNLKDAQNLMLPVQLVQVIPILVMIPIGRDPNGSLAQILSYVPPLTPFVMMNRAAAPPTLWEYVVSTLLLVASIAAALWLAAKLFRVGILLSGKPPALKEIFRWFRTPLSDLEPESTQS